MTILYKPVLISSAEQAEALPIGTMANDGGLKAMRAQDRWRMIWPPGAKASPRLSVVGWSALVPIEAEEVVETETIFGREMQSTTYTTPWEEA